MPSENVEDLSRKNASFSLSQLEFFTVGRSKEKGEREGLDLKGTHSLLVPLHVRRTEFISSMSSYECITSEVLGCTNVNEYTKRFPDSFLCSVKVQEKSPTLRDTRSTLRSRGLFRNLLCPTENFSR